MSLCVHLESALLVWLTISVYRHGAHDANQHCNTLKGCILWGQARAPIHRRNGNAEIADDGTLEVEIHFVDGDEPTLIAEREISSTAC